AVAVREWAPFQTEEESQAAWKGALATVAMTEPSTRKSTAATPDASVARAESATGPASVAPVAGALIATEGGVTSGPPEGSSTQLPSTQRPPAGQSESTSQGVQLAQKPRRRAARIRTGRPITVP